MEIKTKIASAQVCAHLVFEGKKAQLSGEAAKIANSAVQKKEFEGKANTQLLMRIASGKILLVGMGKIAEFEPEAPVPAPIYPGPPPEQRSKVLVRFSSPRVR